MMMDDLDGNCKPDVLLEQTGECDRHSQQDCGSTVLPESLHPPMLFSSMNNLTSNQLLVADNDIILRLEAFTKKYEQMVVDVGAATKIVERSNEYAESLLRSALFLQSKRKIHNIHQSMNNIDLKVMSIQQKLNNIRKQLPPKQHSLVETGPFYYKCVYPGGVRYRDYPSSTAKVVGDDAVVTHNQVIEVAERVFIAAEHSVFLHNRGVGWLFENKKDIICFVRVSSVSYHCT